MYDGTFSIGPNLFLYYYYHIYNDSINIGPNLFFILLSRHIYVRTYIFLCTTPEKSVIKVTQSSIYNNTISIGLKLFFVSI